MKKQVKFPENVEVKKIHQNNISQRWMERHSKSELPSVNQDGGLRPQKPAAGRCRLQTRHTQTINIPKTVASAPFLTNPQLTPGQKRYLYAIADAYSPEHVRSLITRHYMNVLHRSTNIGCVIERDAVVEVTEFPIHEESERRSSIITEVSKHRGQVHRGTKNSKKPTLPKISTRHVRPAGGSTEKSRRAKVKTTKVPIKKKSRSKRSSMKHLEDDDDDDDDDDLEFKETDFLNDYMSSLSLSPLSMDRNYDRLLIDTDEDDDGEDDRGFHSL